MRRAAVILAVMLSAAALADEEKLLFETDSLYHHIIVSETSSVRILRFHRGRAEGALGSDFAQSLISLADPWELRMNYARHVMAGAALPENPKRALFVGLGAGTVPKFFARAFPDCQVDVAELDAKVAEVARTYFFFPELPNLKVTLMDGRQFVRKAQDKYDFVLLDAYRDDMIPFHLMTKEFLEEVKAKLADNAVVVSNIAIEKDAQLYPWMLRTYQNAFGTLFEGNIPGTINRVLIGKAGKSAIAAKDIVSRSRAMQSKIAMGYDLAGCAGIFRDVSSKQASDKVLTDDYAPVNLMKLRKADEKDWEY